MDKKIIHISIIFILLSGVIMVKADQNQISIIPEPQIWSWQTGEYRFSTDPIIYFDTMYTTESKILEEMFNDHLPFQSETRMLDSKTLYENGIFILSEKQKNIIEPILNSLNYSYDSVLSEEGYFLNISDNRILLFAETRRGIFYAIQSLKFILRYNQAGYTLPAVAILDWPDLAMRGITDDMSRGQVSTTENFKKLIRFLAEYKMNVYMPYIEDIFKFEQYPSIGVNRGTVTPGEWAELQQYAGEFHVEVIPIFQTLGHYENILNQPEFIKYAEFPGAASLNTVSEQTYTFLDNLLTEVVPVFDSEYFHIGADESWDVGKWASREKAERYGIASVHAEHYRRVFKLMEKYNKKIMMYGDIVLDNPTILNEIPNDVIMFDWHYYPQNFYKSVEIFNKAGQPFIVSPGAHNWRNMFPNLSDALANIRQLTIDGWRNGALGSITSNWGDYGAMNLRELNYYPYAFAANCAWNTQSAHQDNFEHYFYAGFYGINNPLSASTYQLLNEMSLEVNFLHFLGHPFYAPETKPIKTIREAYKLKRSATLIKSQVNELRKIVKRNRDHLDYLEVCAEFYAIYGEIAAVKLQLIQINNYMIDQDQREKFKADLINQLPAIAKHIQQFSIKYKELWTRNNREDNLHIIMGLLSRLELYIKIKSREIQQGNFAFNGRLTSSFISHPDASIEENTIPAIFLRKEFYLDQKPDKAMIQLIADSHAKAWINGKQVGEVYARKSLSAIVEKERVRSFEITEDLHKGKNIICVEVKNYIPQRIATGNIWIQYLVDSEWKPPIKSNTQWKVSRSVEPGWTSSEFDDQYWPLAVKVPNKWHISRPYFEHNLPSRIEFYW